MYGRDILQHFAQIANIYRNVRTLDPEPIYVMKNLLQEYNNWKKVRLRVLDIGAGTGRYTELFIKLIGESKLNVFASDASYEMLSTAKNYLSRYQANFVNTLAENLPFKAESVDVILTFNAIHHFDFQSFISEAGRILSRGGLLFIYTRTQEQNKRTIWGQFFPEFAQRETRLFYMNELTEKLNSLENFSLVDKREFKYRRVSRLDNLLSKAFAKHYSTFYFYSDDELREAIEVFKQRILDNYENPDMIEHTDENVLFSLKKK
jgi:ubiquinone/menaquinone biosynthesis C-methylase UbiE